MSLLRLYRQQESSDEDESSKVGGSRKPGLHQVDCHIRDVLRRIGPVALQDPTNPNNFDDSILQQGRFWMRTVTWTLVGSSLFGVAWLALAHEEIVIATGQLEPIGLCRTFRCLWRCSRSDSGKGR